MRKTSVVANGGKSSFGEYTWGNPQTDSFASIPGKIDSIPDDPYAKPNIVTWTLGVGSDLATGTSLTPYYIMPRNAKIKRVKLAKKTAASGLLTFNIKTTYDPTVAPSSIFSSNPTIASGAYEGIDVTTFAVNRIRSSDLISIDCVTTAVSTRDVTLVLEMELDNF